VVVEDPAVSRFVGKVLQRAGYSVLELGLKPALEAARTGEIKMRMLITNIPHVFVGAAAHVPLLYVAAEPDRNRARGYGKHSLLQKPFHPADLLSAVKQMS
jgi:DNA-binding response OmpR family regulator